MEIETTPAIDRERVIQIPIPAEIWHETVGELIEFEVQQVNLVGGNFGDNYRRC